MSDTCLTTEFVIALCFQNHGSWGQQNLTNGKSFGTISHDERYGCSMHKQYLLAALDQALLGRGLCAPNPSVGALAVADGSVVAAAWHHGAGTPHAEALLLDKIPTKEQDVTLYVTLEPCNHHGRTPPCVDAIIERGIKRVVYAHSDPNPVVLSGNTPERLRQQGIEVIQIKVPEIEAFYESYDHWTSTGRPWITAKIAQTFDGKIAGVRQERLALSNDACAVFTHQQRMRTDVILTTAKTVRQDNPWFNARVSGQIQAKTVAILDANLTLPLDMNVFKAAKRCHIFHDVALGKQSDTALCHYHGVSKQGEGLDLSHVMLQLGRLGFHDVFVEAGGTLFSALHRADLVNRTYVYLVPQTLGPLATPAYTDHVLKNPKAVEWLVMNDNVIAQLEWTTEASVVK